MDRSVIDLIVLLGLLGVLFFYLDSVCVSACPHVPWAHKRLDTSLTPSLGSL